MIFTVGIIFASVVCVLAQSSGSCADVTIVGWIDGNAITLPAGESLSLRLDFPESGSNVAAFAGCELQLLFLTNNALGDVSNNATDKAYALSWLLKYSGNHNPGTTISPNTYYTGSGQYRLFNDQQLNFHNMELVGASPDPCGGQVFTVAGESSQYNQKLGTSPSGYSYALAEGRVGSWGRTSWLLLTGNDVPWIWSVIEYDANGNPARYQDAANYQIFPTYSVYINGQFVYKKSQSSVSDFINLNLSSYQLTPSQIP
jgi:hypothetical protein